MDPKNYLEMHLHGEHLHPTHFAKINKLKKNPNMMSKTLKPFVK